MVKGNTCPIDEPIATEILPNLFLGNIKAAQSNNFLNNQKIGCILRILEYKDIKRELKFNYTKIDKIHHFAVPIRDVNTCLVNLNKFFDKTSQIIKTCLKSNIPILVHCKRGHHRSATVVAAFMMKYLGTNYISTVKFINDKRGCALRRDTCMVRGLFKYYQSLIGKPCKGLVSFKDENVFNFYCN